MPEEEPAAVASSSASRCYTSLLALLTMVSDCSYGQRSLLVSYVHAVDHLHTVNAWCIPGSPMYTHMHTALHTTGTPTGRPGPQPAACHGVFVIMICPRAADLQSVHWQSRRSAKRGGSVATTRRGAIGKSDPC